MNTNKAPRFTLAGHEGFQAIPENPAPDSAESRIGSVMPLVVKLVSLFRRRLTPRLQGLIDNADCVQEVWLALLKRDHLFDETKGAYTTWARMITEQTLPRLVAPKRIGPRQEGYDGLGDAVALDVDDDVSETAGRLEAAEIARERLGKAVRELPDSEHFVVTSLYGIGATPKSVAVLAAWLVRSTSQIVQLRLAAERRLRDAIVSRDRSVAG
jgi:RNA polymerase sigma factor (sigma-70 family)